MLAATGVADRRRALGQPAIRGAPSRPHAVIALYTVASRTDRPTTWRVGAVTVAVLTAAAMLLGARPWYAQENLGIFAWTGMAAAAGDAVRSRRAFVDAIRERAERAERTREEEARRRVAEERMRIARELHDVVAHHIALVNVQAGRRLARHGQPARPGQGGAGPRTRGAAARRWTNFAPPSACCGSPATPRRPPNPRRGSASWTSSSRASPSATRGPRPSSWRSPQRTPRDGGLPAAVDLTAYRVVQEALTNVHKHAGDGAHAEVRIVRSEAALTVTVLDDGGAGRAGPPAGGATERGRSAADGDEAAPTAAATA